MNYIDSYLQVNKNPQIEAKKAQTENTSFKSTENEKPQMTELPSVAPDYNIKVPMAYTKLDDIKLSDNVTAQCYRLANGQKVMFVPKEGNTVVKTYVNTGSFNEPDNLRGISHYIEHNLFNGSEALGDKVFFEEVSKLGAGTNASTDFSKTDYFIESTLLDDKTLEEEIKLHAGMLTSPKFLLEKLEKEKAIVNSEINMYMSEDDSLAGTQTIKNLFNIKSSSLDLVAGTTDNITNLTREDVVNYFNNNYYPANMTTVITGDVNPDDAMKLIAKYFNTPNKVTGQRHFEKMTPIENSIRQDIISKKSKGAATVNMGFVGPKNNDYKEKMLLQALNVYAGGLQNSKTASLERKYGTGISFTTARLSSRPEDAEMVSISSKVPDDKVEPFLKDLYNTLDKISKNPPTEDELIAIKNQMKKRQERMLESSSGINYMLGFNSLNGNENQIQDFNKIIDSITAEDILNTAKKYLDLNKTALTVVHPSTATKESVASNYTKTNSDQQVSFTGQKKIEALDLSKISEFTLPNNFDVTLQDVNSNTITYRMSISNKDWTPKKAAIADILDDIFSNAGTKNSSVQDLAVKFDKLGLDAYTGADSYSITCNADFPRENTEQALEVLKERITEPQISQDSFNDAVARLKDNYENHEPSAYDNFDAVIYKGLPAQFSAKDKLDSLKDITLDDINNFYKEILEKSQGRVVVSGPFSKHPELKQQIFNSVGSFDTVKPVDISTKKLFKPIEKTEVLTEANNKNQAFIIEGFKFKHNRNLKDEVTMGLMNEILGGSTSSRLFQDLREKRHLAYMVDSAIEKDDDIGVFSLEIESTTENHETGEKTFDNLQKSIEGFNENIQRIKTEKVSEEELENAKKMMKSNILSCIDTPSDKNRMLATALETLYGASHANQTLEMIDKITVDDIYNCANYIFAGKPVYSITATQDTLDANKDFLESLKA